LPWKLGTTPSPTRSGGPALTPGEGDRVEHELRHRDRSP
jgi:hypothetical protein